MKKFFVSVCCCFLLVANVAAQDDAQPSVSDEVFAAPLNDAGSVVEHGEIHHDMHHQGVPVMGGDCGCAPVANPCCPAPVNQCCPTPRASRPMFFRGLRGRLGSRGCC